MILQLQHASVQLSEHSKRVRYHVEHEKRNSIYTNKHVLFCLLYKHSYDDVFDDFPKISDHCPKISEDFPKLLCWPDMMNVSEHFRTFSEEERKLPKTTEEDPKKFRSHTNKFKCS